MRNPLIVIVVSFSLLALAACGSSAAQTSNSTGGTEASAGKTASSATVSQPAGSTTLGETYKDALPIVAQLTLGSLKLDSDASAVGAAQDLSIDVGEVLQAQGPGTFGGGFEGRKGAAAGGGNAGAGGFAGPPPGDFPGGGPGPGGGVPGGGFADASPGKRATAIAERMAQDGG